MLGSSLGPQDGYYNPNQNADFSKTLIPTAYNDIVNSNMPTNASYSNETLEQLPLPPQLPQQPVLHEEEIANAKWNVVFNLSDMDDQSASIANSKQPNTTTTSGFSTNNQLPTGLLGELPVKQRPVNSRRASTGMVSGFERFSLGDLESSHLRSKASAVVAKSSPPPAPPSQIASQDSGRSNQSHHREIEELMQEELTIESSLPKSVGQSSSQNRRTSLDESGGSIAASSLPSTSQMSPEIPQNVKPSEQRRELELLDELLQTTDVVAQLNILNELKVLRSGASQPVRRGNKNIHYF